MGLSVHAKPDLSHPARDKRRKVIHTLPIPPRLFGEDLERIALAVSWNFPYHWGQHGVSIPPVISSRCSS